MHAVYVRAIVLMLSGLMLARAADVAGEPGRRTPRNAGSGSNRSRPESEKPNLPSGETSANELVITNVPPLPDGVIELRFNEFFRRPIGPRGVEFTAKIRELDGQRVRIAGYMIRQSEPMPRCFLLSPLPLTLHEDEYGFCDDMPASVLHAFTDPSTSATVPFTPGLLLLTGKLSIGNRDERMGAFPLCVLNWMHRRPNSATA